MKLTAVVYGGYVYTSVDSGQTWFEYTETDNTPAGLVYWTTVSSSADGTKLAAGTYSDRVYTSIPPVIVTEDSKIIGEDLSGWARACAGTVNKDCNSASRTDGWDGWIKLDGLKLDGTDSYAWGSNVLGWINFKSVIASEPNALTCAYNNQNMQVLPSQGYLCTNGVSSTYPDNLELNETQIEDTTPNGTDVYDYEYNWSCGGNSCSVTTELRNSANSTYSLQARLAPTIVQKSTDLCTVEWSTPENYSCIVRKSDDTEHVDASTDSGHQLEVGSGYYVYCSEVVPTTGIVYKSQTMTCLLNPTIKEI